jgi:hypothetical protein
VECSVLVTSILNTTPNPVDYKYCTLDDLNEWIDASNFQTNVGQSLVGPLKQAERILEDNKDNDCAAYDKIDEFMANVEDKYSSGKITQEQRDNLIEAALVVQAGITCT